MNIGEELKLTDQVNGTRHSPWIAHIMEDKGLCLCDQEKKRLCMAYVCPVKVQYFILFATENGNEPTQRTVSFLNAEFLLTESET